MKRRSIILIVCIVLSCLFVGCKSEKSTEDPSNYDITSNPAPTEAAPTEAAPTEVAPTEAEPTEAAPTEAPAEEDPEVEEPQVDVEASNPDKGGDPDTKDLSQISDYFKDYDLDVNGEDDHELYISTYKISGEYDLNGDGVKEKIQAVLSNNYNVNSCVKVNDITVEIHTDNPTGEVKR